MNKIFLRNAEIKICSLSSLYCNPKLRYYTIVSLVCNHEPNLRTDNTTYYLIRAYL